MLRGYIERRERSFLSREDNRRSLPFEWGLEHLGLAANGKDPEATLREYAVNALQDSGSFYAYEPTDRYEFDGHILKFPSSIETPYPVNNLVWGRFFPAGKDMAVIVLPQWNCKWDGQIGLCKVLQRAGISALRMSMPYHHHRKPSELERAEYLVSPNVGRTIAAARQAVADTRRAADWLLAQGHRKVAVVGTSIGSCIAFLAFAHDARLSCGVFVHASGYYADVVWSGLSTKHVRKSFEGFADLDRLRVLWGPISPFNFIKNLRGTRREMLMLSGRYDLTFLPELSQQAYEEFERLSVPLKVIWFPCGHYTMGQFPFNAMVGYRIVQFLLERKGR